MRSVLALLLMLIVILGFLCRPSGDVSEAMGAAEPGLFDTVADDADDAESFENGAARASTDSPQGTSPEDTQSSIGRVALSNEIGTQDKPSYSSHLTVREGPVAGRVIDSEGRAAVDFTLTIYGYDRDSNRRGARISTIYGENGRFAFDHLDAGEYEIAVRHLRQEAPFTSLRVVDPEQLEDSDEILLRMYAPSSLTGIVLTPLGEPAPGALVNVSKESERTDAQGRFELKSPGPGRHALLATAPSYTVSEPVEVRLEPGESLDNLVLILGDVGRIRGVFRTDRGEPIAGAEIEFEVQEGLSQPIRARRELAASRQLQHGTATTTADGTFELSAVLPGRVSVLGSGLYRSPSGSMARMVKTEVVSVLPGEATFVELISAAPDRQLRIDLIGASSSIKGTWCDVTPLFDGEWGTTTGGCELNADGMGELEVIEATAYLLSLGLDSRLAKGAAEEKSVTGFVSLSIVAEPRRKDGVLSIQLNLPTASVAGNAYRANGDPLGSQTMGIWATDVEQGSLGSTWIAEGSLQVDSDGSFFANHLPAGTYVLYFLGITGRPTEGFHLKAGQALTGLGFRIGDAQ